MRKKVVIGFLGTKLDSGVTEKRWERWRPTVSLFAHSHFVPSELELLSFGPPPAAVLSPVLSDIQSLAAYATVRVHELAVSDYWSFQEVYAALHDFAKGYDFRDDTDYYVHLTTGTHVAQICLFLLTEARYLPAKLIETGYQKGSGPTDHWRGHLETIDLDLSTYDQLAKRFQKESLESQDLLKGGIVTRNEAFNTLIGRIERVALKSTAPMLLTGPTGSGKTALAQRVYELRARRHLVKGALVEVNCATLCGENAMSTLFGHTKGAFTGATSSRPGLLRTADGGTLFLDEIAELGLDEQAMLLRALEDKRFLPLGADKEVSSDFQLLAGTNKDLALEVSEGRFRADLLARLNVWHFKLPGLAQRPEDIEANLDYELERMARELGTRISMARDAREAFLDFALQAPWPGNFRDLAAVVTRLATLADGGRISVADVRLECDPLTAEWLPQEDQSHLRPGRVARPADSTGSRHQGLEASIAEIIGARVLDRFERVQLEEVLRVIATTQSMAEAGRELFAQSRLLKNTVNDSDRVRKILVRFGLDYAAVKTAFC